MKLMKIDQERNFSLLLPVYIEEDHNFLRECLTSIAAQSVLPSEVIICIDKKISAEVRKTFEDFSEILFFKYVTYSGNSQLGGSLNLGVISCQNETIIRMDADDICYPNRFEVLLQEFRKSNFDLLGSWTEEFNKQPGDLGIIRKTPANINQAGFWRNPFNHPTVVFSKQKVIDAGNYRECFGFEDWFLWLRMKKKKLKMGNLQTPLLFQRIGNGFEKRRSGKAYLNKKIAALKLWHSQRLIPLHVYCITVIIETIFRNLPEILIRFIYLNFLRTK